MQQILVPADLAAPFGNYAHGIVVTTPARWLFTSGQLGISKDGAIPPDAAAQAQLCFAAIAAILRDGGMTADDVVQLRGFVTDRSHFAAYMQARDAFLGGRAIASTLVIVGGFTRAEFMVEVEAVACRRPA